MSDIDSIKRREILAYFLLDNDLGGLDTDSLIMNHNYASIVEMWREDASVREKYRTQASYIIESLEMYGCKIQSSAKKLDPFIKDLQTRPAKVVYEIS